MEMKKVSAKLIRRIKAVRQELVDEHGDHFLYDPDSPAYRLGFLYGLEEAEAIVASFYNEFRLWESRVRKVK